MRLFVVGATGRTGGLVVQQALERGHEVTAFTRRPEAVGLSHPQLHVARGDGLNVADPSQVVGPRRRPVDRGRTGSPAHDARRAGCAESGDGHVRGRCRQARGDEQPCAGGDQAEGRPAARTSSAASRICGCPQYGGGSAGFRAGLADRASESACRRAGSGISGADAGWPGFRRRAQRAEPGRSGGHSPGRCGR